MTRDQWIEKQVNPNGEDFSKLSHQEKHEKKRERVMYETAWNACAASFAERDKKLKIRFEAIKGCGANKCGICDMHADYSLNLLKGNA